MSSERTRVLHAKRGPIAWLAITSGQGTGRDFRLGASTNIGREASQNDVILDDDAISATHARIRVENGVFFLYDLASTNRTSVNGEHVERVMLRDGDVITLGVTTLVFKLT